MDDPSGPWIVRVAATFPEPWTRRGGRAHEALLLSALAAHGLPVAREASAVPAAGGLPVAVIERKVPGAPLTERPRGEHRRRLARRVAEVLTELHRFPADRARALGMPSAPAAADARRHLDAARPFLSDTVHRWLDAEISRLEAQDLPTAVVHRDIRAEHLYVDADGDLVGLIDFGDATLDDPALDFAKLAGDFGDPFVDLVLTHYRGPADRALRDRARLYRRLDVLWEAAEDAWGDRPSAVRRLRSFAAAATRAARTSIGAP